MRWPWILYCIILMININNYQNESITDNSIIFNFEQSMYQIPNILITNIFLEQTQLPPFAVRVNKRFEFKKLVGRLRPWKLESLGNRRY